MTTQSKQERYAALVCERKQCHQCHGLRNPAEHDLAQWDSDQIGPWSRLHGNLDADLMIVGQDWGDLGYYTKNRGLDDLSNQTMRNLEEVLRGVGLEISLREYGTTPTDTTLFLTNSVLCLKKGGMSAKVEKGWRDNCGKHFLRRQIEIISPRVVVAMGKVAYQAILASFDLPSHSLKLAVEEPAIRLPNGSQLFAVYHCVSRVRYAKPPNGRPLPEQLQDWQRVADALKK